MTTRRVKLVWDGERGKINGKEQNNNVHVAKLSDEVDNASRRCLSLKEISS